MAPSPNNPAIENQYPKSFKAQDNKWKNTLSIGGTVFWI